MRQSTARQLGDLLPTLDEVFIDRVSGKSTNRPELQAMLKHIRKGDTLHALSLDRIARNTEDLLRLVRQIKAKDVTLHFAKEKIMLDAVATDATEAMMDDLTITIFGASLRWNERRCWKDSVKGLNRRRRTESIREAAETERRAGCQIARTVRRWRGEDRRSPIAGNRPGDFVSPP